MGSIESLRGLTPAERARLDRFARLFERVDASEYPQLTELAVSDDVLAAQDRAVELLGSGARRDAVREAIAIFVDEGTQAYSRRMSLPDTFLLFQSLPDRAEDRVRFLNSVERVVVALILWDDLEDDDRAVLLGPWADLVLPLLEGDRPRSA
jgi:hypothetical protein